MRLFLLSIYLLSTIWLSACASMIKATAPDELARTLDWAIVAIPETYIKWELPEDLWALRTGLHMKVVAHELAKIPDETKIPLVIYMHGCSGLIPDQDIMFLARNNYAVLAPNSLAREYRPRSCNPNTHTGGLFRPILDFRLAEASYAHEAAKTWPWVDKQNIFMMGFSEGGITTAKYSRGGLAARIILGWTCTSGWFEYSGISGPRDEPILAVVASKDPWFTHRSITTSDNCGRWMASRPNSESVVVDSNLHSVQGLPEVQEKILHFLEANRRP